MLVEEQDIKQVAIQSKWFSATVIILIGANNALQKTTTVCALTTPIPSLDKRGANELCNDTVRDAVGDIKGDSVTLLFV